MRISKMIVDVELLDDDISGDELALECDNLPSGKQRTLAEIERNQMDCAYPIAA